MQSSAMERLDELQHQRREEEERREEDRRRRDAQSKKSTDDLDTAIDRNLVRNRAMKQEVHRFKFTIFLSGIERQQKAVLQLLPRWDPDECAAQLATQLEGNAAVLTYQDTEGMTLLMHAARASSGGPACLQALFGYKIAGPANEARNSDTCVEALLGALCRPAKVANPDIAAVAAATMNLQDKRGRSALHHTFELHIPEGGVEPPLASRATLMCANATFLVREGVDVTLKDSDGRTALAVADLRGCELDEATRQLLLGPEGSSR